MNAGAIRRSWVDRAAMTAVFVANGIGFGVWAGNIPRLRQAAGLDNAALGIVLLCVSLGAVAAMPLVGRYAARVGTARASWMAALALGVALPLPAYVQGWTPLLAAALLLGVCLGALDVCMNAHAAAVEQRWGAAIMSSFHAGWSLGQMAGAASAGVLAGAGLMTAMALPGAVVAAGGLAAALLPEQRGGAVEPVRFAWPSAAVLVLCALIALSFAIEGGTADWSGVYLRTVLDVPEALASVSLVVFAGTMVVFRLWGDALVRRLGPVRTISWGSGVAAAGLAVALAAPGVWSASAGFALVGAGVANIVPVVFSAAGRRGAAGVSMVATAGYGAVMVAPPLIGFVSQELGLRTALLLLVAGAGAMAWMGRFAAR
jgi:fucose permease